MNYRLTTDELTNARARVAKINARADKNGLGGRWELTATPTTWTETNESGVEFTAHGFDVELGGDMPKLPGGWSFVGTVKNVEGRVLVSTAPGAPAVSHEDVRLGACDHCGTKRTRQRVILVVDEAGNLRQVGGQCVKDYLGQGVWFYSFAEMDAELSSMASGQAAAWAVADVVRVAMAAAAGQGGYRASSYLDSTRGAVADYMFGKGESHEAAVALVDANPVTLDEAKAAIAEVVAEFEGAVEGYRANMLTVLRADYATSATFGLVVSATSALAKLRGDAAKKAAAPVRVSAFIGSVGDKVSVEGVIVRMQGVETMYGWTRLVVVDTAEGTVKMFTTAKWVYDFNEGDRVVVSGTVKAHEEYQGHRQTMLTRPKGAAA